jgi:hypothetical protein
MSKGLAEKSSQDPIGSGEFGSGAAIARVGGEHIRNENGNWLKHIHEARQIELGLHSEQLEIG